MARTGHLQVHKRDTSEHPVLGTGIALNHERKPRKRGRSIESIATRTRKLTTKKGSRRHAWRGLETTRQSSDSRNSNAFDHLFQVENTSPTARAQERSLQANNIRAQALVEEPRRFCQIQVCIAGIRGDEGDNSMHVSLLLRGRVPAPDGTN
eukprot:scaffold68324_cov36-Attheya_sp.AAC.1